MIAMVIVKLHAATHFKLGPVCFEVLLERAVWSIEVDILRNLFVLQQEVEKLFADGIRSVHEAEAGFCTHVKRVAACVCINKSVLHAAEHTVDQRELRDEFLMLLLKPRKLFPIHPL